MTLTRRHLDVALFGTLLLFGGLIVRGWMHESEGSPSTPAPTTRTALPSLTPVPPPRAAPARDAIALVERLDPAKDQIVGTWSIKDGRLITPDAKWARLQMPVVPPEEYDLSMTVTRLAKEDSLILGCVFQGQLGQIVLDGNSGAASWMEVAGGGHGVTPFGVTYFEGRVLSLERPAELRISVRKGRLSVTVDSFQVLDYIGPPDRLFVADRWDVPNPKALFVGAWESVFVLDHLQLIPVQGNARFLR